MGDVIARAIASKALSIGMFGVPGPQGPKGDPGTNGTGVTTYATLAALQAALPSGSSTPVWVVADNAWYYWNGTAGSDTTAPTVTANPAAGTYSGAQSVVLSANETATIYYTTDGSTPTEASSVYSSAISVAATGTIKAIAKDTAGNVSTPVSFAYTITVVTIPATPATPTATAGDNKVDLGWTAVSGATSYKVYRGGTLLASPTTNSYSDTTALNGTSYSYTVSAVNTAGESAQSSAVNATPVSASISITDSFTGTDGTLLNGRATETGSKTWSALVGNWNISGNAAATTATVSESVLVIDSGVSDGTAQIKITNNVVNSRIIFRYTDATNLLLVQNDGTSKYALFKKVAGTYTQIGASAGTAANNDILKVVLLGTSVTVYNNNVQIMTATITEFQTATKHGIGCNTTSTKIDDFSFVS